MDEQPRTRVPTPYGWAEFDAHDQVRMGNRLVPRQIVAYMVGAPDQPSTMMIIDVRKGIPVCTGITFRAKPDGREVRVIDLRALKIDDWVETVVAEVSPEIVMSDEGRPIVVGPTPGNDEARRLAANAVRAVRLNTRIRITDDHLRQVADVYIAATDGAPLKTVERVFGTSRPTAARWVKAARTKGLIPPRGAHDADR